MASPPQLPPADDLYLTAHDTIRGKSLLSPATLGLGLGAAPAAGVPTQVGERADWLDVEAGETHTCAIVADGGLFCFGSNGHSELGQGAPTSGVSVPTQTILED